MNHHFGDLLGEVRNEFSEGFPWTQIGVFPNEPDDIRNWFNYTVGLGKVELHLPCASIEGRCFDNQFCAEILNTLAGAWRLGLVHYGDEVAVPLGITDDEGNWAEDRDGVFWISTYRVPSRVKQVNFTGTAPWTVPLLWSSPLGWPE